MKKMKFETKICTYEFEWQPSFIEINKAADLFGIKPDSVRHCKWRGACKGLIVNGMVDIGFFRTLHTFNEDNKELDREFILSDDKNTAKLVRYLAENTDISRNSWNEFLYTTIWRYKNLKLTKHLCCKALIAKEAIVKEFLNEKQNDSE
jgi:hypothetical protein